MTSEIEEAIEKIWNEWLTARQAWDKIHGSKADCLDFGGYVLNRIQKELEDTYKHIQDRLIKGIAYDFDRMRPVWEGQLRLLNRIINQICGAEKKEAKK